MYENDKQILMQFEDRLRKLISEYDGQKKLNDELSRQILEQDNMLKDLQNRYAELEQNYINLKQAKMISLSYEEVDSAKERISGLVREIDQCIDSLIKKQ